MDHWPLRVWSAPGGIIFTAQYAVYALPSPCLLKKVLLTLLAKHTTGGWFWLWFPYGFIAQQVRWQRLGSCHGHCPKELSLFTEPFFLQPLAALCIERGGCLPICADFFAGVVTFMCLHCLRAGIVFLLSLPIMPQKGRLTAFCNWQSRLINIFLPSSITIVWLIIKELDRNTDFTVFCPRFCYY